MGSSRIRRPETDTIAISGGDTLTVKRFLTAGEFRTLIRNSTRPLKIDPGAVAAGGGRDMSFEIDPTDSGVAMVLAYLLDWTFQDFDGRPIVIRDQPESVVRAALDSLDADSYMEVQRAIQKHDRLMSAYIADEKKTRSAESNSAPTLQSVG